MSILSVSQSELARRIGVDRSAINHWLTLDRTPTRDNVRAIARALAGDDAQVRESYYLRLEASLRPEPESGDGK